MLRNVFFVEKYTMIVKKININLIQCPCVCFCTFQKNSKNLDHKHKINSFTKSVEFYLFRLKIHIQNILKDVLSYIYIYIYTHTHTLLF